MIEGFLGSFIIGLLGTAGPRITSTPHLSKAELLALLSLDLLAAGVHFGGAHGAGDALFCLCLTSFLFVIGKRFIQRKDSPPPNFALGFAWPPERDQRSGSGRVVRGRGLLGALRIGALLLEQGFVLLPILDVAPFLLPRLLGIAQTDDLPESRALPPGWISRATFAAGVGLTNDGTFVIETSGLTALAAWLRVAAVALYLA